MTKILNLMHLDRETQVLYDGEELSLAWVNRGSYGESFPCNCALLVHFFKLEESTRHLFFKANVVK